MRIVLPSTVVDGNHGWLVLDVAGVPHITSKLVSLVSGTTGSTWEVVECRSELEHCEKLCDESHHYENRPTLSM